MNTLGQMSRERLSAACTAGVVWACALLWVPSLQAATPELVGIIALAAEEEVAKQLELEPSQRTRLRRLIADREDAGLSLALDVKDLPPDERSERLAPFRRESERLGMQILTFRQRSRLRRIHLQRMGMAALGEPGMAESLNLSDEQRQELEGLIAERAEALHTAPTIALPRIEAEYREKMLGLLGDSQREAFESVVGGTRALPAEESEDAAQAEPAVATGGEPVDPEQANADAASGDEDPGVPHAGHDADAAAETAASSLANDPLDEQPDPAALSHNHQPMAEPRSEPPQSSEPIASIRPAESADESASEAADLPEDSPNSPAAGSAQTAAPAEVSTDSSDRPPVGDGLLRFNFQYAPWQDVIEWFAERNDLALQMDASPQGTFNYTDSRSYTLQQALDLINRILLAKGFTLVRNDKMLFVIRLDDGIPPNLVRNVSPADLDELGESELVSVVFPLSTITTEEAKAEIEPLLRQQGQGSIVELPRSRRIQVTETAGRLRLIRSVLEAIESPAAAFGELEQIELAHRLADEVLPVVREMFEMPEESNALPDGSLRVTVGLDGQRLLVRGTPERIARLREVVELIDEPGPSGSMYGTVQTPQLEVYPIAGAEPAAVLRVLQTILAGDPDARLEIDEQTGNLYALARPSQHATIRATIAQAEQDARQIDVIPLTTVDPQVAVLAIGKLFGGTGESGDRSAPTVDADPTTRSLLVRGTASQLQQVRSLLEKLGENTSARVAGANRGNVRLLPLGGREATSALYQIEQIWPTLRPNRIRIVSPSSRVGIPAYRPSDPGDSAQVPPWQARPPQEQLFDGPSPEPKPETSPPQATGTEDRDDTAATSGKMRIRFAAQAAEKERSDEPLIPSPQTGEPPAPILVAPGPGGLLIASEDTAALDELESLLAAVSARGSATGREFAVFYLRYGRASIVAQTLSEVFGGGSGGGSGGAGLIGDIAGAALGEAGGLVTGLLGMNGGGGSMLGGSVDIVPDDRLNILVVEAKLADLDTVEQLLRILDQPSSPEEVQVDAPPRLIPVYNTSAAQIAGVVQQVYQDRMRSGPGQQQQPSPEDIIRLLRGGRGEGGGQSREQQEASKMSLGIDERSNSLVVRAPDPLFLEVKLLVETLDDAEVAMQEATRVVSVKSANSATVQRALAALYGGSVQTSSPPQAPQSGGAPPTNGPRGRQGDRQSEEAGRREFFEGIRRFQQFQQQLQQPSQNGGGEGRGRRGDGRR